VSGWLPNEDQLLEQLDGDVWVELVPPPPTWRQLEWAIPVAAVLVVAIITVAKAGSLPARVGTNWDATGQATGNAPLASELILGLVVVALGAAFIATADLYPAAAMQRALVVAGHVASVGGAVHLLRIISANLDVAHWSETTPAFSVPAVLAWAAAAGGIAWLLSRHREPRGLELAC
jgi:hypothetical protein